MSRPLPPLNALRAFEASARHLSFTRAAIELCVTQAAVSHQIKEMEETLGSALFERSARQLRLTAFGEQCLPRVKAILRRATYDRSVSSGDAEPELEPMVRGKLQMDPARHHVKWDGKSLTLTVTEFMILEALANRPGVVRTRDQLMDAAYQDDVYVDDRTIDSHIKRLRRKFREVDPEFAAIDTLYGAGYRFADS